jgi:hypothetical protein
MIIRSKSVFVVPMLAVLVVGVLAACSSTPSASGGGSAGGGGGSSSGTNVCNLVSASAAGSAMGLTFTGAKSTTPSSGEDACTYATSTSAFDLIVEVYQPSSGETWTAMENVMESLGPVKSVSGVGDKASLSNAQFNVQAGSRIIAIAGDPVNTNLPGTEALAKKLISALG